MGNQFLAERQKQPESPGRYKYFQFFLAIPLIYTDEPWRNGGEGELQWAVEGANVCNV